MAARVRSTQGLAKLTVREYQTPKKGDCKFRKMMNRKIGNSRSDSSSKGVLAICKVLQDYHIEYQGGEDTEEEFIIPDTAMSFDFYLPDYRAFIEFHGRQHYEWVPYFHETETDFRNACLRDDWKEQWAKVNGYSILVIPYHLESDIEDIVLHFLRLD